MQVSSAEWLPAALAPSDQDLEVCVLDYEGIVHALAFPCNKDGTDWVDARSKKRADLQPTHWRMWERHQIVTARQLSLAAEQQHAREGQGNRLVPSDAGLHFSQHLESERHLGIPIDSAPNDHAQYRLVLW